MKLTPAQITNLGITRLGVANSLYQQLAGDVAQIALHNADKNNPSIDPAPFNAALTAGQQIIAQITTHVANSLAPTAKQG